jgi:hypothetical protein
MLKSILKIMEKSKAEDVDIIVATRMLIHEGEDNGTMEKALAIYNKVYEDVSYLKNNNNPDGVAKVIELACADKFDEIKEYMKEVKGE